MKREIKNNYQLMIDYLKKNGFIASCGRIYSDDNNICKYRIELFIKTIKNNTVIIDIYNTIQENEKELFNIIINYNDNIDILYNRKELILILNFIKKSM